MTRPATLPELLAQGKVKPGGWVECVESAWGLWTPNKKYQIDQSGHIWLDGLDYEGDGGTFRPVKPAKAKKWGGWLALLVYNTRIGDVMREEAGFQVKRTKDGSLMIRYRKKSHDDAK